MPRKTETYTEEVERQKTYYECDGPSCWRRFDGVGDMNVLLGNPVADDWDVKFNRRPQYKTTTEHGYGHYVTTEHSRGTITADGELFLCDECYGEVRKLFHPEEDRNIPDTDDLDEEDEEKAKKGVWQRVLNYFGRGQS